MRRLSSNSTTVLTIEYRTPMCMDMPKLEPADRRSGRPALTALTVPDPSMSGCREASAIRSKMASGVAGMTRSTETTSAPTSETRAALHDAAVGEDGGGGQVAGPRAGQKDHHAGDLLRLG